MHVIGHNDVPANSPTMSIMSHTPLVDENFGDIVASKNRLSIVSARCHKINRSVDPNALQPSQMFVHIAVVAEGADLGNLRW